jgi:hypothetical protein
LKNHSKEKIGNINSGDKSLEKNEIKNFRVILKKEEPSTDIKNVSGVLSFLQSKIQFLPSKSNPNLERTYNSSDLTNIFIVPIRKWFKKKDIIIFQFLKGKVSVSVYFDPIDVSPDYLLQETLEYQKKIKKGSLSGVFGSLIEKIGTESQKIVREFGAVIESSSREITQALGQTTQFIREATKTANLLNDLDVTFDDKKTTINLDEANIDEILKKSLESGKIEAMIAGLIAKGLYSAKDQKFTEARDALNIAREAATKENLDEYKEIVNENIKEIENAESDGDIGFQLNEKAMRYADDARKIVAEWEKSKKNEENDN